MEETTTFSTGDLAQLRSGGPNMTVGEVSDDKIACHWFTDDGKHCLYEFLPEMLAPVEEESEES